MEIPSPIVSPASYHSGAGAFNPQQFSCGLVIHWTGSAGGGLGDCEGETVMLPKVKARNTVISPALPISLHIAL